MKITPEIMAKGKWYADGALGYRCGPTGRLIKYWYRDACLNCGEPFLSSCLYKNGVRVFNDYCSKECVDKRELSEETRARMRASHLGQVVSEEARIKIGNASRGKARPAHVLSAWHSAESKAKARAGRDAFVQQHGGGNLKPQQSAAKHSLYTRYKRKAFLRGIDFDLTEDDFLALTNQSCFYCGAPSSIVIKNHASCTTEGFYIANGLDRLDSTKGYIEGNVVPCCSTCNVGELARTASDFISWVYRVAAFKSSGSTLLPAEPSFLPAQESIVRAIYQVYKHRLKKRDLPFSLTHTQVASLISRPCTYCGAPPFAERRHYRRKDVFILYTGIDRVDSSLGYVTENVVPCCKHCNWAKQDMSVSDFYAWIDRVVQHQDGLRFRAEAQLPFAVAL